MTKRRQKRSHSYELSTCLNVWGGADKFLALPGRKQATVTKLWIYSTHLPWSPIHFLARWSDFSKPLKKKFRMLSIQPGLRGSSDLHVGWKMMTFQLFFQSREQVVVWWGQIQRIVWVIKILEAPDRPVSYGLQVPGELGHCCTRTWPPLWPYRGIGVFPSKCPSIAPAEMINTPRWQFGPLEDNQWGGCRLDPKKSRRELFQRIFALRIFWDRAGWDDPLCRHSIDCCFVSSLGHSDITRFHPWSPITTGYHLDCA